jgi:hypothetical protein
VSTEAQGEWNFLRRKTVESALLTTLTISLRSKNFLFSEKIIICPNKIFLFSKKIMIFVEKFCYLRKKLWHIRKYFWVDQPPHLPPRRQHFQGKFFRCPFLSKSAPRNRPPPNFLMLPAPLSVTPQHLSPLSDSPVRPAWRYISVGPVSGII